MFGFVRSFRFMYCIDSISVYLVGLFHSFLFPWLASFHYFLVSQIQTVCIDGLRQSLCLLFQLFPRIHSWILGL